MSRLSQRQGTQQHSMESTDAAHGKSQPSADEELAQAPANRDRGAAKTYEREEERAAPQREAAEHLETEKRKQPSGHDSERF